MDGDVKEPLKIIITDFYKLHKAKGKEYTFKQFKKSFNSMHQNEAKGNQSRCCD